MGSELKRRKINPPPRVRASTPTPSTILKATVPKANDSSTTATSLSLQQAKNYAVGQAQQEGCTGNFRIFDSPFGNYLIPVIPTRAELSG